MSAFHEDTHNLSAALDSLLSGARVAQQPRPRIGDSLRRLSASQKNKKFLALAPSRPQTPPSNLVLPVLDISVRTGLTVEMLYDR